MDSNTAQSEDRLLGEEETCSSPQQASETESRSSSEVPPLHVCAEAHQQLASLESFILTDPADFAFTDPGELVLTDPADPKTKAEPDCDASPSPTQPYRMWAKQNWLHELLACLTSLLALIGIIVLVRMYDGEPTPQWPRMITINSAVALLTIIVRGSIVFATAEGISQLKWTWFRRPQLLLDLSAFDRASRGPWGALLFIFRTHTDSVALLGAILTIAALGISPFAQQIVAYEPCDVPSRDHIATVPATISFDTERLSMSRLSIVDAIYHGLAATASEHRDDPLAVCTTNKCTFQQPNGWYMTLGVWKECTDMSSLVQRREISQLSPGPTHILRVGEDPDQLLTLVDNQPYLMNVHAFGLRTEQFMHPPNLSADLYNASPPWKPNLWPRRNGVFGFTVMQYTTPKPGSLESSVLPVAVFCQFHPVVFTVNATIDSGALNETVVLSERLELTERTHFKGTRTNESIGSLPVSTVEPVHSSFYHKLLTRAVHNGLEVDCNTSPNRTEIHSLAIGSDGGIGPYPNMVDGSIEAADEDSKDPVFQQPQRVPDTVKYVAPECYAHISEAATSMLSQLTEQLFTPDRSLVAKNIEEFKAWKNLSRDSLDTVIDRSKFGIGHLTSFLADGHANFTTVDKCALMIMVAAMYYFRTTAARSLDKWDNTKDIKGITMLTKTCARARWWWIAPPATLVLLAFSFILTLAWRSRQQAQQPDWPGMLKSSPLPLLLYGTQDGEFEGYEGPDDSIAIEKTAESLKVMLVRRRTRVPAEKDGDVDGVDRQSAA